LPDPARRQVGQGVVQRVPSEAAPGVSKEEAGAAGKKVPSAVNQGGATRAACTAVIRCTIRGATNLTIPALAIPALTIPALAIPARPIEGDHSGMTILRSALFNAAFFAVSFVMTLAASVARVVAPDRVLDVAMLWARILVAAVRMICGIRLQVSGLEQIPPGAALIASRHQSAFDTFVWLTLLPRCCYVFKDDLLRIPLFGPLIKRAGMIAVDRGGGGGAIRSRLRQADRAVREQRQIVIFPEGTRAEPGSPRALQPGIAALAARTGLPVIPVATDSGHCWGRRAFRKRAGTIRIVIGPAIPPQTERKALIQALEDAMAAIDREPRCQPSRAD
jgi:1-acyl-sn-glycerol-3-phosphate acyltransferase